LDNKALEWLEEEFVVDKVVGKLIVSKLRVLLDKLKEIKLIMDSCNISMSFEP
jgi:hypothetical protein